MSEDDLDTFTLRLHDLIQRNPLLGTEEGFDFLKEFVYTLLEGFCTKERNYN